MKAVEFDFEKAIVSVERVRYNPCANSVYEVIVHPKNGTEAVAVEADGGIFDSYEDIAKRVYNRIVKENRL